MQNVLRANAVYAFAFISVLRIYSIDVTGRWTTLMEGCCTEAIRHVAITTENIQFIRFIKNSVKRYVLRN